MYRQFASECIMEAADKSITIRDIFARFKDWFKESFPGNKIPPKNDISGYFTNKWGESLIGGKWKGYYLKMDCDEVVEMEDSDFISYDAPL